MVNTVTFPVSLGGDGSTVTDDASPTTGLDGGGHRTRFVPALSQTVIMAGSAVNAAVAAAASSASAINAPGTNATSISSVLIATGSKAFTLAQTGKQYAIGQTLVAASAANPANFMAGQVTAFNSGAGTITLNVSQIGGSGTFADWVFSMGVIVSSTLPSQAGNASKFLFTNGTSASWVLGLQAANNLSDVASVSSARTNLGLGSIALLSTINDGNWSGTDLAIVNGGTGSSTAGGALANLGAAASGANTDILSITGLTTALGLAYGGTGATTATNARTNLGLGSMATQSAGAVAITGGTITGIAPLGVAAGGTGSSTAGGARSNLGAAAAGANADITSLTALTSFPAVEQTRGLKVSQPSASQSTVTLTADVIVMVNANGVPIRATAVNCSPSFATVGAVNGLDTGSVAANSFYDLYAITNGSTVGGLLVLTGGTPVMPSGYTFKAFVGMVRTDGSGNVVAFNQFGSNWRYVMTSLAAGQIWTFGASASLVTFPVAYDISAVVPLARVATVVGAIDVQQSHQGRLGPNANVAQVTYNTASAGGNVQTPFEFVPESQYFYWGQTANASNKFYIYGFTINLG